MTVESVWNRPIRGGAAGDGRRAGPGRTHGRAMDSSPREGFADRLRRVRAGRFGVDGIPRLARLLSIPERTWANYEAGVRVPGDLLLQFLVLTGAEPRWLLEGEGPMFRDDPADVAAVLEFPPPVD